MIKTIKCPFCKKPLNTKLIVNFYFCKECEIAVRNEADMPLSGVHIYDKRWVKSQENEKYNFRRAVFIQTQIRNLDGIMTVLDIGCGTGILVDILNRSGYLVDGIDNSPEAIEFAKSHRKGNFYLSSIECFKREYKYDIIIATQLIEHLRNPESFLINVKRLLNPGGYIYIETPNLYSWSKRSIWRKRIGGMYYGIDHRICYTTKSLSALLRNNGFEISKIFTKTYSPTLFIEIINTLILLLKKDENTKEQKNPLLLIQQKNETKNLIKSACKKIYKQAKDSFIINAFLLIPNRISEINKRGNQLIFIARNNN